MLAGMVAVRVALLPAGRGEEAGAAVPAVAGARCRAEEPTVAAGVAGPVVGAAGCAVSGTGPDLPTEARAGSGTSMVGAGSAPTALPVSRVCGVGTALPADPGVCGAVDSTAAWPRVPSGKAGCIPRASPGRGRGVSAPDLWGAATSSPTGSVTAGACAVAGLSGYGGREICVCAVRRARSTGRTSRFTVGVDGVPVGNSVSPLLCPGPGEGGVDMAARDAAGLPEVRPVGAASSPECEGTVFP